MIRYKSASDLSNRKSTVNALVNNNIEIPHRVMATNEVFATCSTSTTNGIVTRSGTVTFQIEQCQNGLCANLHND